MERWRLTVRRALLAGMGGLLFFAATHRWTRTAASAAEEPSLLPQQWEYAQIEFVGILPDAYSSSSDYRSVVWRWSSAEDGVLRREDYVAGVKSLYEVLAGRAMVSSIKDGDLMVVMLLDAIGAKGWELVGYDERAIPVIYSGLFHAGSQVTHKWVFRRSI